MINGGGTDLSDFSMLDLFRSEMEMHAATLNEGLLALESDPGSTDPIESLMRAAHSIKGGARIVELDAAVKLAHTMEDSFVAAQKGELSLSSDSVDVLLRGVDMLNRISDAAGEGYEEWLAGHQKEIDELAAAITRIHSPGKGGKSSPPAGRPPVARTSPNGDTAPEAGPVPVPDTAADDSAPEPGPRQGERPEPVPEKPSAAERGTQTGPPPAAGQEPAPSPPAREAAPERRRTGETDRMVRVTASKIERLMSLAGEVVVSVRWLPPFYESLVALKKNQGELFSILEKLQEMTEAGEGSDLFSKMHQTVLQAREKARDCNQRLVSRINRLEGFTSSSENLSDRLYHEIIGVRMRPFADGIQPFPRMVRDLARELGKKVRFTIVGKATEVDRDILEKLEAPLSHLLRNALDHGIETPEERAASGKEETGELRLEAAHRSGMLMITVADDGRGVDLDELRAKILNKGLTSAEMLGKLTEPELMEFLFLPSFSTREEVTEISGRGVGLDVVHSMVHEVGGIVRAVSRPGKGLSFHLELPLTLSVIRTFIVEIDQETYAFPLARIDRCLTLSRDEIDTVEDRQYFRLADKNISLVNVRDVLELEKADETEDLLHLVVISDRVHSYGLMVDAFVGEYDLVVRPLDPRLGKVSDISAMAIMLDGAPVLIFDIDDLVRSIDSMLSGAQRLRKISRSLREDEAPDRKQILVVDDSITVREMERKLLESKGYQVDVAVDGMDAWNLLRTTAKTYDMVVSDIDMPRMNGIELITHMKGHEKFRSLPVMVVSYKNTEEDRLRGMEAGANYYLTKSSFQDNSFIEAVLDLIGEP